MQIGIDPGYDEIGIAPIVNGKPISKLVTIHAKGETIGLRCMDIARKVYRRLKDLEKQYEPITKFALEDFEEFYPPERINNLRKLFTAQGTILGLFQLGWPNNPVIMINKKQVKKSEADLIAKLYGFHKNDNHSSKDSRDALHMAALAGFLE